MKFYKVFSLDVNASPFKEIMGYTDNIYVADDTVYFTTTLSSVLLISLFCQSIIPYDVMTLTNDQAFTVMSNRVQFNSTFREFCTTHTNIATFHTIYKFYDTFLKTGQVQLLAQTIIQPQPQPPQAPQDTREDVADDALDTDLDIDQLLEQWAQDAPNMDALDEFLDNFPFEEAIQDMVA
jgi:hypothetical protein